MQLFRTEGIILHTINFKDYDKILTVFTESCGLIKLVVHGARSKRKSPVEPLIHGEFLFAETNGELVQCKEMSVINRYLHFRENFSQLETACDFLQALQLSQMVHKPSPNLYKLLKYYLERLSRLQDPKVLAASFRLKILVHDGLLSLAPEDFEPYFVGEEIDHLSQLINCKTFSELSCRTISDKLSQKVKDFFRSRLG